MLADLIAKRDWTQEIVAVVLDVDKSLISKVIAGKRAVDAPLALKLGELFEIDPAEFLDLQASYDLAVARITERPDPDRKKRAYLYGELPVRAMIKRGWVAADSIRDTRAVEESVAKMLGPDWADGPLHHAAKKTNATAPSTPVQEVWLRRCRQVAAAMLVPEYSEDRLRWALTQMSRLLLSQHEVRHVPRLLAEAGVRFVIVESLPMAKIDGACLWLDPNSPVVAMSIRFDRIDNFWFVLRHEIEHVLRRDGLEDGALDAELDGARAGTGDDLPEAEREANRAAQEFCVPQGQLKRFMATKEPRVSERDFLAFARMVHVHPGLVAGQLQHHSGRYDRFRKHQVKVRSLVVPCATVDGWGEPAPLVE